jgi:hypothetical protein
MSEHVWLETPIHKNVFASFKLDEKPEILEALKMSFDGSIMAVRRDKVAELYEKMEVSMVRMGYKKPPDKFKIEDEESFFKYMAYHVVLE